MSFVFINIFRFKFLNNYKTFSNENKLTFKLLALFIPIAFGTNAYSQHQLDVVGPTTSTELVEFTATSLTLGYDVVQIVVPAGSVVADGDFLECRQGNSAGPMVAKIDAEGNATYQGLFIGNNTTMGVDDKLVVRNPAIGAGVLTYFQSADTGYTSDDGGSILQWGGTGTQWTDIRNHEDANISLLVDNTLLAETGNTGSTYAFTVYGSGLASGGTWMNSDRALKENIATLKEGTLDKIMKLNPVNYDYKKTDDFEFLNLPNKNQIGFVAQELEEEFPELVQSTVMIDRNAHSQDQRNPIVEHDLKAVNYAAMVSVLTKAMQEQQAIIEAQQSEINNLLERVESLENK